MRDVYILGIYATPVRNYVDSSFRDLVRTAYVGALNDAGLADGDSIDFCYFSNFMADFHDQKMCRGNNFCIPLINEGLMRRRMPIFNQENGCASASAAVHSAWKDIMSGQSEVTLAMGVEKMNHPDKSSAETLAQLRYSEPQEGNEDWCAVLEQAASAIDMPFGFQAGRSMAMDFYALLAREHMNRYGTTKEQIAHAAAKNHQNSLHNPRSQYHFDMSVLDVMNDREICDPLTRAMCAPVGDGAAAVILCSGEHLQTLPSQVRERALKVRAAAMTGGVFLRKHQDDRAAAQAANLAYKMSGLNAADIDVAEVHDASSFAEIHLVEDLQFCERGQGGPFTASGATAIDGDVAVNASGGLVARGHPIGATGIMMLNELAIQLRNEAGHNQVANARIGLAENAGGLIGLDTAICSVIILEGGGHC